MFAFEASSANTNCYFDNMMANMVGLLRKCNAIQIQLHRGLSHNVFGLRNNAISQFLASPLVSRKNSQWENNEQALEHMSKQEFQRAPWESESDSIALVPFKYLNSLKGHHAHTKLASAFNHWFNVPQDTLEKIKEIMNMVHVSSLLCDDICDGSTYRRGKPAAHIIFGMPFAWLSSTYVTWLASHKVRELNSPKSMQIFTEQMMELSGGQALEIYCRDTFQCPTEEFFMKQIMKKATASGHMLIQLLQECGENKDDFSKFGELMGLYFQLFNDLEDIHQSPVKKSYCEDMTAGTYTFPVIHAIQTNPQHGEIQSILKQRTNDESVKQHFVTLLEKYGSLKYTSYILEELEKSILQEIEKLGGNPKLQLVLSSKFSQRRSKDFKLGED